MRNWDRFLMFAAIAFGLIVLYTKECGKKEKDPCYDNPETIILHDTIPGDSIPFEVLVPAPYPVEIISPPETLWKTMVIDTMAILSDYFSKRIYNDTLKNDSSALVAVLDTVYMNQLWSRNLIFQNRRATAINTYITNYPRKSGYNIGAGIIFQDTTTFFAVRGAYRHKRFVYGVDFNPFKRFNSIFIYKHFFCQNTIVFIKFVDYTIIK